MYVFNILAGDLE